MNSFSASILRIDQQDSLCLLELDASGIVLDMLLFDLEPSFTRGSRVNVLFKETEVSLAREPLPETSILNCFPAVIREIRTGRILADIGLHCKAGEITGIISMKAVKKLLLKEYEHVTVMIKASQISIETIMEKGCCCP